MTFAEVYDQHVAYLWKTVRRLGVAPADIEDITHDVFVIVHGRLATFDRTRPIRPWLFGIAFRRVANYRRHSRNYREVTSDTTDASAAPTSLESQLAARNDLHRVAAALATLDHERRAVFVLSEIDLCSGPEIAGALELPLNTVYSHLRRARRDFTAAFCQPDEEVPHVRR
jgi:RNA polymerase sigma-70 factor (ECF subfamily)